MSSAWPEIQTAKTENRHEIKLAGAAISERISKNGIDPGLFSLDSLNLLNISDTSLSSIPDEISNLVNLQTLLLYANKLDVFNKNVCKLAKLKVLDLSRNELTVIPEDIGQLTQLTNINLSGNHIDVFPSLDSLTSLITLDLSNNRLVEFPDVCYDGLPHFSDLKVNGNKIEVIPGKISILPALKNLDISENCVKIVPFEVSNILKLKEINLKGNCLTDKRLAKLVDQCRTKQVVDYVRQHSPKSAPEGNQGKGGGNKKGNKKSQGGRRGDNQDNCDTDDSSFDNLSHRIQVLHFKDDVRDVKITDSVKVVRPHIVCCIVNGLCFTEQSFRKFIQMQTKLHDTICEKRNSATIATHDVSKLVPGDLLYTARPPEKIEIIPLMRNKKYSGQQLFLQLQQEAENLRKEKKRNVYSGIHKFLYLLEGKPVYPCLEDSAGNVISFPPITNSEISKMSHESKSMFVEVTSAASQGVCKLVMDIFLKETLILGITRASDNAAGPHHMEVQQVRITDLDGNMKTVYPSRADLNFQESESIKIIRE